MTDLFLPEADEEFREAARYYENECPGLGLTFITAVHKAISWIMENPMYEVFVGKQVLRFSIPLMHVQPATSHNSSANSTIGQEWYQRL